MALVWIDLETTGLSSDTESVLEVACVVTDDALNALGEFQRVIYYPHAATVVDAFEYERDRARDLMSLRNDSDLVEKRVAVQLDAHGVKMDPYVLKMHDDNGLWKDCRYGQALDTVDRDLSAFILKHGVVEIPALNSATGKDTQDLPQLAGSTISFDRGFLGKHFPRTIRKLHYRNVDVSSFNETAKRFWPDLYAARPRSPSGSAHRGMPDIIQSIAQYAHYLAGLAPVAVPLKEAA